jgi:hypothetical protein
MTLGYATKGSPRRRVGVKPPPSCQRHAYSVTGEVGGCPWCPRAVAFDRKTVRALSGRTVGSLDE